MLWLIPIIPIALVFLFWLFAQFKTGRPDGTLAKVHPYRKMMPIIMPTRNESVVYFEHIIDATAVQTYLETHREALQCNISHILVASVAAGFHRHPKLNRFIAGQRIYQRDGVWISFSMKRKKLNAESKIATIKLEIPAEMSLADLCDKVNGKINRERSDEETYLDKELSLFLRLPHFVLQRAAKLLFWANDHNMLPDSFIREDGMFTGAFVANLGSLGMDAGFHHLYEWGTCPLFIMVGQITEREITLEDGTRAYRPTIPIRFSYDERVEDGLTAGRALSDMVSILEDPTATFGEDGKRPLGQEASS